MATIPKTKSGKSNNKVARSVKSAIKPATPAEAVRPSLGPRGVELTEAEEKGIRELLENPPPPTEELKARLKAYRDHAAAHPDSGW